MTRTADTQQGNDKKAKTNKKRMPKSKKFLIAGIALLLAGVCVIFYPNVAKFFTGLQQNSVIDDFNKRVENTEKLDYPTDPEAYPDDDSESPNKYSQTPLLTYEQSEENREYDPELLARLYNDMVEYNRELYSSGQQLLDPFCYQRESFDLTKYSVYDNVFGYVSAPSINLNLPIYLGASEENLWLGATHMTGTSVPIGGENTNAVLAAHRGVVNMTMFDNIVFLNEGDSVYVTNLWYTMEYKVVKTEIILPTESDKVKIQPGKDMLTLVTCHPYGYSDYRYIVYCERA